MRVGSIGLFSLLFVALPALGAQCDKPTVPARGLATTAILDQALTLSDGYKTYLNLTYPKAATPKCGWPLVVFVHGYGGRRTVRSDIARWGFAVAAYDVRGQGTARIVNPKTMGMTFYGATEKYDLADVIAWTRKKWPKLIDPNKLAVTGGSQGGIHSWFAAAYSGRKLSIAGRGTITFPKVDCVVPQNFVPDVIDHALRGGTLFSVDAVNRALGTMGNAQLDPSFTSRFKADFIKQDPVGLAKYLRTDPGREVAPLLSTTQVPILCMHAWLDGIQNTHAFFPTLTRIPATTPLIAMFSTIGHGSPGNNYEAQWRNEQRIRWFDRFLWGKTNGVDKEARYQFATMPLNQTYLRSRTSLWNHRHDDHYPATDVTNQRLWLSAKGALELKEPTPGSDTTITHKIKPGYTPTFYAANASHRTTGAVLANIPLSQRVFAMAPLVKDAEVGGTPRISLRVVPDTERFTIMALLRAKIPGQVQPTMISSWAHGVLGAKKGVAQRLEFDLAPTFCILPKGSVLELVISNHWLREAPMSPVLVSVPYFVDSKTLIRHGKGADASFLDLPLRKRVRVGLVAPANLMYLATPYDLRMELRGGIGRANDLYLTLATLSGHTPGITLPGGLLRLRPDVTTDFFLQILGNPLIPGFVGTLDSKGLARPTLAFKSLGTLPKNLAGVRLCFATWVFDSPTALAGSPTAPLDLFLR